MNLRWRIVAFLLVMLTVWMKSESSFVDAAQVSKEKKGDNSIDKKDGATASDDAGMANMKDKKAGEEIMFGNQQNRGIMEELMNIADRITRPGDAKNPEGIDEKNDTETKADDDDEQKLEEALQDDDKKGSEETHDVEDAVQRGSSDPSSWYENAPMSDDALQYLLNNGPVESIQSPDDVREMYDQEVYRRKRQLSASAPLRRRRSLRNTLEQMMQTRTRRLPRRSMRYKREVDMEDLLAYLGKNDPARYFDDQAPRKQSFSRQVDPQIPFPYKYGRNEPDPSEEQEEQVEVKEEDMDLPRFLRYTSNSGSKDEELQEEGAGEEYPEWMAGGSAPLQPSIFTVTRRSSPLFYPIDYRYIPGFKKKRSMPGGNEDADDAMFGKWGRVVQAPSAYASAEDVARLFALADMLTEGEYPEKRNRRQAN